MSRRARCAATARGGGRGRLSSRALPRLSVHWGRTASGRDPKKGGWGCFCSVEPSHSPVRIRDPAGAGRTRVAHQVREHAAERNDRIRPSPAPPNRSVRHLACCVALVAAVVAELFEATSGLSTDDAFRSHRKGVPVPRGTAARPVPRDNPRRSGGVRSRSGRTARDCNGGRPASSGQRWRLGLRSQTSVLGDKVVDRVLPQPVTAHSAACPGSAPLPTRRLPMQQVLRSPPTPAISKPSTRRATSSSPARGSRLSQRII